MLTEKVLKSSYFRYGVGYLAMFSAAAWKGDFRVAFFFVACFATAQMIQFYVVRTFIDFARGRAIQGYKLMIGGLALFSAMAIGLAGFWAALVLSIGVFFFIDAVVLRFRS